MGYHTVNDIYCMNKHKTLGTIFNYHYLYFYLQLYKELTTNDVEEQIVKLSSTIRLLAEQQRTLQETVDIQAERLLVIDEMAYELNQSQSIIKLLEEQLQNRPSGPGDDYIMPLKGKKTLRRFGLINNGFKNLHYITVLPICRQHIPHTMSIKLFLLY